MNWIERIFGKKEKSYDYYKQMTDEQEKRRLLEEEKRYVAPLYEPSPKSTGYV